MTRVQGPWTVDQVLSIGDYQTHPDTARMRCLQCPAAPTLIVHVDALRCPTCGYEQTWVFGHTANGRWRMNVAGPMEQVVWLVNYWRRYAARLGVHLPEWLGMTDEQYDAYAAQKALPEGYQPPDHWMRVPWPT